MKKLRKMIAFLLALVMCLGVAATTFAADTGTITITDTEDGYVYKAYQIFTGDLSKDGTILSNIEWGSGINASSAMLTTLSTVDGFSSITTDSTASDVAAILDEAGNDSALAKAFANCIASYITGTSYTGSYSNGSYTISGLPIGYYLVINTSVPSGTDTSYSRYILALVGGSQSAKSDVPTVEKKVKETNDSTGNTTDWQDAADYDIGDSVPFQLTATLPDDYEYYKTYTLIFHDTLSTGLTFTSGSVKVYVVNGSNSVEAYSDGYAVSESSGTLTITIDNTNSLKTSASNGTVGIAVDKDSEIVVEYTAELNSNAVIGSEGNPNTVCLEYSNNPNPGGSGNTGTTPVDKVIVFTYEVDVNKVDESGGSLAGAEFTLYKWDAAANAWVAKSVQGTNGTVTEFTFTGLDAGKYKLSETETPDGYNTAEDIIFEIVARYDTTSDDPQLTSLTVTDEGGNEYTGFNVTMSSGEISTNVVNQKGAILPSTGGIGTTIFYIIGGILMIGAAVLLITKKRMEGREDE